MASVHRLLVSACALAAGLALSGCDSSDEDSPSFPPPAPETFIAQFSVAGVFPFPSDYPAFVGSADGTLNYRPPLDAAPFLLTGQSLNALDGFSTSSHLTTSFSLPIREGSLNGSTIRIVELYLSNTNKGPAQGADLPPGVANPVRRVLSYGTDFTASVSDDIDSGGKILKITPLKPLTASTGLINIGYVVLLTDGITDIALRSARASTDYATVRAAPANCSGISNPTLAAFCPWFKGHLAIGQAIGVNPANVVLSWSFSTQSVDDTFVALDQSVTAQPIAVQATPATSPLGKANIYVGTTRVPYYSETPTGPNDASFLNSFWVAAGPSPVPGIDPASRFLTRFNPVPLKRADVTIPLLVTVPNATANMGAGCPKPTAGWPVVVVQHGLQRSRKDALAMADSFAEACVILAAIDLPMHGITNTADPLYQAANERTFNVDLINNTTGANRPDGVIDPSGEHLAGTLLGNPLAGKDIFLKQGEADLGVLAKSLANLDVTGDGQPDIDRTRIHYTGLSLGGIVGVAQSKYASAYRTATVAAPGGPFTRIALESPAFLPLVKARTASQFAYNSTLFNNFFREVQTLIDSGDPINHICNCASSKPLHLIKVNGDTVIPNSTTDNIIRAANFTKLRSGVNAVAPGQPVYVAFTKGSHGSLFDPTSSPAATAEMQRQSVLFATSAVQPGGPFVVITDPTVVEQ
jgi:hypothetical protein